MTLKTTVVFNQEQTTIADYGWDYITHNTGIYKLANPDKGDEHLRFVSLSGPGVMLVRESHIAVSADSQCIWKNHRFFKAYQSITITFFQE